VDIVEALLKTHAFLGQKVAVHVYGMMVVHRESEHIVVAHVERMLHDNRQVIGLLRLASDAENTDTVESPCENKKEYYNQYDEYRYAVDTVAVFYGG
jgi:hypothetical protein